MLFRSPALAFAAPVEAILPADRVMLAAERVMPPAWEVILALIARVPPPLLSASALRVIEPVPLTAMFAPALMVMFLFASSRMLLFAAIVIALAAVISRVACKNNSE